MAEVVYADNYEEITGKTIPVDPAPVVEVKVVKAPVTPAPVATTAEVK